MDADPVTTLTIAVLFGGGSGGLVSWWIKGVIDRSWKDRARELDAKVSAQARETEQLRAHSLGLEAERRRNFEAKRAEVVAEVGTLANSVFHELAEAQVVVHIAADDPNGGRGHLGAAQQAAGRAIMALYEPARAAALFVSRATSKTIMRTCGQFTDVSDAIALAAEAEPGSNAFFEAVARAERCGDISYNALHTLLAALREELLSAVETETEPVSTIPDERLGEPPVSADDKQRRDRTMTPPGSA